MELPDLLLKAIESACSTRRQLSWKIQEGPKGTLIQLVWKSNAVNTGNASEVVGTNWSIAPANPETPACRIQQPYQKKKKNKNPSRIRRDAKRLQAYLEGKNAAKSLADVQPTSADEPLPHSLPKPISKTSARSITAEQTPTSSQHPRPATPEQQPSHLATEKVDFQQELDGADVSYEMRDGVPGLLCVKCDKHDWIPIRVLKSKYWKKFEQPEECLSDDSESGPEEEYSHEYLKNCKRLRYFKSKNGNPALSIATGRLKFPTPIAQRTRSKIT